MVIFLPNEIDGLAALEKRLPELSLEDTLKSTKQVKVQVALPKFKLEKHFDLNEVLQLVSEFMFSSWTCLSMSQFADISPFLVSGRIE